MDVETITREMIHLNRQVAELTTQRDILQDNLTICQFLDKASAKLQGNRISDNELRHCTSLVSLVNGSDEKFKNSVNFVNEIRKLSLDRLGFLCFAFVRHASWKSFQADRFDQYMKRKSLTVKENPEIHSKLQRLCNQHGGLFKEIYHAAAQLAELAVSQDVCERDGGVSTQLSLEHGNKRPHKSDGNDLIVPKRQCFNMAMYSFSYADKIELRNVWSPEIMQILENGRLWGIGRTAGNVHCHSRDGYHEYVMLLDGYVDLSKTKVFKGEEEWGEVSLEQVYQLVVRSTAAKAMEVAARLFSPHVKLPQTLPAFNS